METRRIAASPFRAGALVMWFLSVTACGAPDPNVATHHNDNFRTGAYLAETVLTPAAVRNRGMRVRYWLSPCNGFIPNAPPGRPVGCIDGALETQPLYVRQVPFNIQLPVGSATFTAPGVFLATMTNKVYGIHAETGQQLWMTDLMLDAGWPAVIPGYVPRGIASTPVIDVANNRMYVLFGTKNQYPDLPTCLALSTADPATRDRLRREALDLDVRYWIAMLDLRNGDVLQVRQIIAVVKRSDGSQVGFLGKNHISHPGLLLDRGSVYVAFGSVAWSEGCIEYHGWLIRYNAQNLDRLNIFNTSRDWRFNVDPASTGYAGSGIWQGGGGLAADSGGNVYFLTGNGRADTSLDMITPWGFARQRTFYGDSFLKVTPSGDSFKAWAYTPPDAKTLEANDGDLGSGGAMIVPDSGVVLGGGKSGYMYVLDRSSMGLHQQYTGTTNKYNASLRGETWDKGPHLHGSPTYWAGPDSTHGYLYVWGEKDVLRQYRFNRSTQRIDEPPVREGPVKALWNVMPGGMLSVSANGTRAGTGIVWATLPIAVQPTPHPGGLYAFDAETLSFLWNTSYGTVAHWVPPTIADGKVFLAEGSSQWDGSQMLIVYELGRPDGSDRGSREPYQPQSPPTCKYCHTPGPGLEALTQKMSMSDHHATGGGVRVKPGLALAALVPPPGHIQVAVLEGNGQQVYEATPVAGAPNTLEWILRDSHAELIEIKPVDAGDRRSMEVRHSKGSSWSASDGSAIAGEIEKRQAAPEAIDTDWLLYKVTKEAGKGFLSRVTYVRKVFTHAGRPPTARPTRRGERVTVAYSAQYWLYR